MGNIAEELICQCCKKRPAESGNMCLRCEEFWFEAQQDMWPEEREFYGISNEEIESEGEGV